MASIEEVKAQLLEASATIDQATQNLSGGERAADEASEMVRATTASTTHPKVHEALAHLTSAKDNVVQAQQLLLAAKAAIHDYTASI